MKKGFARRLRSLRESFGVSQVRLARALGIPQSYVAKWEAEAYDPSEMLKKRVARIFRVSPAWLMEGVEPVFSGVIFIPIFIHMVKSGFDAEKWLNTAMLAVGVPKLASVSEIWQSVSAMSWPVIVILSLVAVWNLMSYGLVLVAATPGLTYSQALVATQSATAACAGHPAAACRSISSSCCSAVASGWGPPSSHSAPSRSPARYASSAAATFILPPPVARGEPHRRRATR